jgi:hypothetical protein
MHDRAYSVFAVPRREKIEREQSMSSMQKQRLTSAASPRIVVYNGSQRTERKHQSSV